MADAALSPDGRWLAYVVKRARSTAKFHKYDFLNGGDRGDVWLVDSVGGVPRKLTGGTDDGSGYWAPSWSPDSERLAMLSTRGGNVHLWGYDVISGGLAQLSERPVDLNARGAPNLWVSDRELLVATLPEGERPLLMTVETQAAEAAIREWPKTWKGHEPTRSALDSGLPAPFDDRPQGALLLVDAETGGERTVMTGFFRRLRMAPDGSHVAFFRQVDVIRPEASRKLGRTGHERLRLGVVTAAGGVLASGVEEFEEPLTTSLRWAPDSGELALIGRNGESSEASTHAFRYRLADGRVQAVTDASLEPTSVVWTAERGVLVLARPALAATDDGPGRADWWLVRGGQEPRKLTAEMNAVPTLLVPEEGLRSFVGLADGDVFRVSADEGCSASLTANFEPTVTGLVWPTPAARDGETFATLILAADHGGSTAWHRLDLRSGELSALRGSSPEAWLLDFAPEHDTAVLGRSDRTGTGLWLSTRAFRRCTAVVETNAWLREIAEAEAKRIDYGGLDGDDLKGWVILPVGHEPSRRYPLIVWVYPGVVFARDAPPARAISITSHHSLSFQLLPARGYAVLLPSMPLKDQEEPSDPYMELTKGVLPAVDRAIEMGIADGDRLGLIGQSYGGYGTYGLITQTPRFRAAVALAGFSDLVSLYGQFDARFRYDEHAHEHLFRMSLAESGQNRMGGPPWQDVGRYVRNSPLFHADRVDTPLLIIQGDMDYVPLQQGEQFFTALYRQGKRARFVRYWGEGHVFQSPPNIRDMWEEIYRWFDEFLKPAADHSDDKPRSP